MASKTGQIEWDEYCRRYLKLMRERYDEDRPAFHRICEAGEVVLLCYCRNTVMGSKRCHRYLLADVLVKVAIKKLGIDAKYMGERVNHTNQVTQGAETSCQADTHFSKLEPLSNTSDSHTGSRFKFQEETTS